MKTIILLICINNLLVANSNYELKLYEKIFSTIFQNIPIKIYGDKSSTILLKASNRFEIRKICDENVDLIIGKNFTNLSSICKKKPLFATSYRWYKSQKNSFGTFYWRKGRPQIKFKKDSFKRFHLHLPQNLIKYAK